MNAESIKGRCETNQQVLYMPGSILQGAWLGGRKHLLAQWKWQEKVGTFGASHVHIHTMGFHFGNGNHGAMATNNIKAADT